MGTLPYCSPEVLRGQPYNYKTDVWALGCILYELVTSKRAFDEVIEDNLKHRILSTQVPVLPANQANFDSIADLRDIQVLCMHKNQEDRPTVRDILSLTPLRQQAKRLKIDLGIAGRSKSLSFPQLVQKLQQDKLDLIEELDLARPNLPTVRR